MTESTDAPADDTPPPLTVTHNGIEWGIPDSFDDLSIDAVEAFSCLIEAGREGDASAPTFQHTTRFLSELLGPRQWARFKRDGKAKDATALFTAIMEKYGETRRGE